jgi:hypothetical protein
VPRTDAPRTGTPGPDAGAPPASPRSLKITTRERGARPSELDTADLLLDGRLLRAALWTTLAMTPAAAALGAWHGGAPSALAAVWGAVAIGLTAAAAAWLSAQGGRTSRGIGIGRVVAAVPGRLVVVAAALAVGVGPLGFPSRVLALAVCVAESVVLTVFSCLVIRGRTFVGPLIGKVTHDAAG